MNLSIKNLSRRALVGIVGGAVVAISAVASAVFTMHTEPWAGGEVTTVVNPQATYAKIDKTLNPGYAEDAVLKIKNTNDVAVKVTGVSFVGWRNCNDPAPSLTGKDCRLEDFLTNQLNPADAVGIVIAPGQTKTLTLKDAVGLKPEADDARQGKTFEAGYFVAFAGVAGNEVS